jgi:4-amino-4-deoxy-L-arabinose transferase-like glycosyltransferase
MQTLTNHKNLNLFYLLLASIILSLVMLHSNELWTMESRWATVCWLMLRNHDYFHPYLFNGLYFDKPLLSYWLIVGFAKIFGQLNEWTLRLPSALAGITSIYCVYRLGKFLFNEKCGLYAGWLLLTTYFFMFWTRTASADMLNVAGILLSLNWYFEHKEHTRFGDYLIFFLIMSLTSLCKGLEGFIIPLLGVMIDLTINHTWKNHLNWRSIVAAILAFAVYLTPFITATLTTIPAINQHTLQASGIYEVFSENFLRYFHPFDHENPWYTYFVYVPFYLLPWTFVLFFSLKSYIKQWRSLQNQQRWLLYFLLAIFIFFSLSGSRRGYYILPLVPFAILLTADFIANFFTQNPNKQTPKLLLKNCIIIFYTLFFIFFALIQPYLNYTAFGAQKLAMQVNEEIKHRPNIKNRNIWILNSKDNSLIFYLDVPYSASVTTVDMSKLFYTIKNSLKINELPILILTKENLSIDSSSLVFPQDAPAESKRSLFCINEHCEQERNTARNQNAKSIQQELLKTNIYKTITNPNNNNKKNAVVLIPQR